MLKWAGKEQHRIATQVDNHVVRARVRPRRLPCHVKPAIIPACRGLHRTFAKVGQGEVYWALIEPECPSRVRVDGATVWPRQLLEASGTGV